MPSVRDFLPIFQEDVASVRARVDADANSGVAPTDQEFLDTTVGGFYFDITQAVVLEIARLWDALASDYTAAAFPASSWGPFLDLHGVTVGLTRKVAAPATGTLLFTGADGTLISTGTQAAIANTDPAADPILFETTEPGVVDQGSVSVPAQAVAAGAAGNVAASHITVVMTPIGGAPAVSNPLPFTGGADIEEDDAFSARILIEYQGAHGAGTISDYKKWALAYPSVAYARVIPLWRGPGTVKVVVTDVNNDPVSQKIVDGLQEQLDPPNAETMLSAAQDIAGATITVTSVSGFLPGPGFIEIDGQLVGYESLGATSFADCSGGLGTYAAGEPVVQRQHGHGLAPIGAFVTVSTPVSFLVAVTATLVLETEVRRVDVLEDVIDSVSQYLNGLEPGGDVVLNHVQSRFFLVPGVLDVTGLLLNGFAADIPITDQQVPTAGKFTIT